MKLTVPNTYREGFVALLGYEEPALRKLQDVIAQHGPRTSIARLSEEIAASTGLDADEVSEVLFAVGSLHPLVDSLGVTPQELVENLKVALGADQDARLSPDIPTWSVVEEFLRELIGEDSPLALTAKASALRFASDKSFCTAKVFTDLRPVFGTASEEPLAAMAVHNLRISYHLETAETKEFFVALNRRHLLELKTLLDRALKKEEQLRKLLDASSVRFLDEGEDADASD